jgi:ferredoxin
LSALRFFREEYNAHIIDKKCPAKVCKALIDFSVIPENCTGCTVCARNCPENAISGAKKEIHHIDPALCVSCGICETVCKFDAILVE